MSPQQTAEILAKYGITRTEDGWDDPFGRMAEAQQEIDQYYDRNNPLGLQNLTEQYNQGSIKNMGVSLEDYLSNNYDTHAVSSNEASFGEFLKAYAGAFAAASGIVGLGQSLAGTGLSDLAAFESSTANLGNGFWDAASVANNAAPIAEGITFGNAEGIIPDGFDIQQLSADPQGLDAEWPNIGGEQGFQTQNLDLNSNLGPTDLPNTPTNLGPGSNINLPDMTGADGPWSQFAEKAFPTDFSSSIGSALTPAGATAGTGGAFSWLENILNNPLALNALGGIANQLFNNTPEKLKENAQTGAAMADPFATQRPFYQGELLNIYNNPNYLETTPWYKGLRDTTLNDVSRSMAARGYNMSSNETKGMATELQNRSFQYLQPWTQMTGQFAGAGGNPGTAGQIYTQGANAGTLAGQNQMGDWAQIFRGIPELAGIFTGSKP